jgi:hypothetical protein
MRLAFRAHVETVRGLRRRALRYVHRTNIFSPRLGDHRDQRYPMKLSTVARMRSGLLGGLSLAVLMSVLAGCGGSDAAAVAPPASPPTPPAAIEGIATPSSVAVVTATNAQ